MTDKEDPIILNKKRLPDSGWGIVVKFVICVFIAFPIWLLVILPLTIVIQILKYPFKSKKPKTPSCPPPESIQAAAGLGGLTARTYDLVLFGATGFTGQLAARYLAKTYGSRVKWALVGRRPDALETLKNELIKIDPSLESLPILIADSSKPDSLKTVVMSTKVVITTVGPYSRYGSPLVAACAQYGTSYCDITGESDWVREMVDRYDNVAKQSGAHIVHFCGHDCIPWDLLVLLLSKKLKENGESLSEVHLYDEISSQPSGGTLETVFHILENRVKYKATLGFDPLLKSLKGDKSENKTIASNQSMLGYSSEYGRWVGPFLMAMVMANCVRRSNALSNYSSKLLYKEARVYAGFMAGVVDIIQMIIFGTSLFCPPLLWLLRTFVLPKPGQGPSEKTMDGGFLKITGFAKGDKGSKAKAMIYFPTDPGYRDTARMLVESGLTLALDHKQITVGGGVWTPAPCLGEVLLRRLQNTGTIFRFL